MSAALESFHLDQLQLSSALPVRPSDESLAGHNKGDLLEVVRSIGQQIDRTILAPLATLRNTQSFVSQIEQNAFENYARLTLSIHLMMGSNANIDLAGEVLDALTPLLERLKFNAEDRGEVLFSVEVLRRAYGLLPYAVPVADETLGRRLLAGLLWSEFHLDFLRYVAVRGLTLPADVATYATDALRNGALDVYAIIRQAYDARSGTVEDTHAVPGGWDAEDVAVAAESTLERETTLKEYPA